MQIQVDRKFLDQCWIGWGARCPLEPVCDEGRQRLDLLDTTSDSDSDRERRRSHEHPRDSREAGAAREPTENRDGKCDDPMNLPRKRFNPLVPLQELSCLSRRANSLVAEHDLIDCFVDEIRDGADERDGCSTRIRAGSLARSHGDAEDARP